MGTATMTASSARWCAREGSRGGNGVQGKREAVEGVEASPWRREGVGEAATAKQEVAKRGGGARHRAASCAGTGRRQEKGARWAGPREELGRLGCTGEARYFLLSLFYNSVLFYLFYFLQFVFDLI